MEESRPFFRPGEESFVFRPGGKAIQVTRSGVWGERSGPGVPQVTWTQQGACVSIAIVISQFNDKNAEYRGIIKGNRIEGTGETGRNFGNEFTWAAVRRGGGGVPGPAMGRLVRTGRAAYERVEEKGEIQGFSFTVGPDGKLLDAGAQRKKDVRKLYDVSLYLDEAGARQVLGQFKAKDLQKQVGRKDIHEAVLTGAFDKVVTLRFARAMSAKDVRQDFAESLGARTSLDDPAVADFVKCVGRDFQLADEVVIRVSTGQTVWVSVAGSPCPEISSPSFSRALLGIWIGKDTLSGQAEGLLSGAAPLLKQ